MLNYMNNLQISDDVIGHIKFNEVIRNITEIKLRSKRFCHIPRRSRSHLPNNHAQELQAYSDHSASWWSDITIRRTRGTASWFPVSIEIFFSDLDEVWPSFLGQKFEGWFLSSFSSNAVNLFYKGFTFVVPLNEKGTRVMIGQNYKSAKKSKMWPCIECQSLRYPYSVPSPRQGMEVRQRDVTYLHENM